MFCPNQKDPHPSLSENIPRHLMTQDQQDFLHLRKRIFFWETLSL